MRGKPTDILVVRAIQVLYPHFTPKEIMTLLKIPKRTAYDLIERARERDRQAEVERKEREITQASLQPEWREREKESISFTPNVRKYYS